ncbi:MAG: hypothetical protein IJO22_02590 [Oscillospiraceae bacterium]|nr:hypothetical protein [Oscillospiraceae bacterium]
MSLFDTVIRVLEEVYIAKNFSYAEEHLPENYVCHCSAGTKSKAEAIALAKKYVKKHDIKKIYSTVENSSEETITLNILFECVEKEKFLGITFGEHRAHHRHLKTFRVKDGIITESRDEFSEFEYEE